MIGAPRANTVKFPLPCYTYNRGGTGGNLYPTKAEYSLFCFGKYPYP